ncbi:MAG: enoyl-CoA hydratase/isomerase family protein, partial [Candidatus Binatia bacterium]
MADGKIEQRKEDGILILEINHPPVNSYTHEMLRQLDDALIQARFDEEIHAIVLTGSLEKFFSAGADINMLAKQSLAYKYNFSLHGHEVLSRLEDGYLLGARTVEERGPVALRGPQAGRV